MQPSFGMLVIPQQQWATQHCWETLHYKLKDTAVTGRHGHCESEC